MTTPDERSGSERPPGHEYYSDSIAQMVQSHKSVGPNAYYGSGNGTVSSQSYGLPSNGGFVDQHNLTRLSFEMWVSLPNVIDQALHTYTRLQSSSSTLAPMPVEDVRDWRRSFPSLRPIVENWSAADQCDIILLEASFQLMSDFPPRFSKLGISLELDFLHPSNNNAGSLANFSDWACVTHMFQHGRLDKKLAHEDCHVSGLGKVKPFFESKWWASTFTQLTEKRKMAEDSKNDAALDAANETSRNFFRGLTVMQEISADTMKGGMSNGIYTDPVPRRKRMAILLWKFSQAPAGYVGTTTWQKLIPPPHRTSTNSPTPLMDVSLPSLTMDSVVENGDNELFTANQNFMSGTDSHYNMFTTGMDDELCQDGFMDYRPDMLSGFDALHSTFDIPSNSGNMGQDLNLPFDIPNHDLPHLQDHIAPSTSNFFEVSSEPAKEESRMTSCLPQLSQHGSFHQNHDHVNHQPLANFDMNTHQRLQAQLSTENRHRSPVLHQPTSSRSTPSIHHSPVDAEDEALRVALLAASAMSDLNGQTPRRTTTQASYLQMTSASQPAYIPATTNPFTSPPVARPPLQTHHSFAGIGGGRLHSRQSSRGDFEKTLANFQAFTENHDLHFPFDLNGDNHAEGFAHDEVSRPHSQPTFPATTIAPDIYDELHALHGGSLENQPAFSTVLGEHQSPYKTSQIESRKDSGLGGSFVEIKHEDLEDDKACSGS